MIKYHKASADIAIAELTDEKIKISEAQDILEIMSGISLHDCSRLVIHERNLHEDFFILKTGLAGEILQKFSNYRMKLAIIGEKMGLTFLAITNRTIISLEITTAAGTPF